MLRRDQYSVYQLQGRGNAFATESDAYGYSTNYSMLAFLNPFLRDFTIHISSTVATTEPVQIVIVDAAGKPIAIMEHNIDAKAVDILVTFPESLPAGVYYILATMGKDVLLNRITKL